MKNVSFIRFERTHGCNFPSVSEDEGYEGGENQEHLPPTQEEPPPTHRRAYPSPMGSRDTKKGDYPDHQMYPSNTDQ